MKERKIGLHRTKVGDRYVMEAMRKHGLNLGGEQSGHLILGDHATTGDALVAALQVLAALLADGRKASVATKLFTPVPQILKNVKCDVTALNDAAVAAAIAAAEKKLGSTGRVVVRPSGTEPLVRVMIEGANKKQIDGLADGIAAALIAASITPSKSKKKSA